MHIKQFWRDQSQNDRTKRNFLNWNICVENVLTSCNSSSWNDEKFWLVLGSFGKLGIEKWMVSRHTERLLIPFSQTHDVPVTSC